MEVEETNRLVVDSRGVRSISQEELVEAEHGGFKVALNEQGQEPERGSKSSKMGEMRSDLLYCNMATAALFPSTSRA